MLFPTLNLIVLAHLVTSSLGYENSSRICDRCKCSQTETYFQLNCKNASVHEVLAEWPPHNKTLKATFSGNNITTLKELPPSDYVVELIYDHCNIMYLEGGVFRRTSNVQFADLSFNSITSEQLSAEAFRGAYNNDSFEPIALKQLNLAYNQIHSLIKNLFEHMLDLEELNLEGNDFEVLDINTQLALESLNKLERLNLANNGLTELVPDAVKSFNRLIILDLSNNLLDFVPDSLLQLGSTLEILKLNGNPIVQITDSTFLGFNQLTELYMNDMPYIKTLPGNSLASLKSLKKLEMQNCKSLKSIDRQAFNSITNLIVLNLRNNSINTLEFETLNWSKLKILDLTENPLKCDCNLFNITSQLDPKLTRAKNGPICMDPRDMQTQMVFDLDIDICQHTASDYSEDSAMKQFSFVRMLLVTLSVVMLILMFIAAGVAITKYKKISRNRSYPFLSQVSYNPLTTNQFGVVN